MLRLFNLTYLILTIFTLQGCTKTVEVSYGEIKPELRLKIEDIIDLDIDSLNEKYLGKEISILDSRYAACGYRMGIANACISGFSLTDSDAANLDTLSRNEKTSITISAYFNYSLEYHLKYITNFPSINKVPPSKAMLESMIYINEDTSQTPCISDDHFAARVPSSPDKPWQGCEFTLPDLVFSGLVFSTSKETSKRGRTYIRLHIVPIGLKYSYEASRFL